MNRRCHTNPITPHGTELSITGGSFCFPCFMNPEVKGIDIKRKRDGEYRLGIPGTTGQSWQMLLSDGKVKPCGFGKTILTALRYFSRKPCLTGSIYRRALVVQRAAKARVFTIKINSHESSICHKRAAGSHEDAHARNKKKENRGTRTGCQVPATGDDRTGTRFHIVEPHSGNMPPSRQEQAAGGIIQ